MDPIWFLERHEIQDCLGAARATLLKPMRRAGRNRMAFSSANTALKVMPKRRKGMEMSQRNGKAIRASKARGQHKTKRIHQPTNSRNNFILKEEHGCALESY